MMINCPKCGFLQDKDQYCASCGVNMESWRPPKKPFLKKLLSNWIFQLAVLFIIVVVIVLRDSFFPPQETKSVPDVSETSYQRRAKRSSESSNNFAPTEKVQEKSVTKTKKKKKFEKLGTAKSETLNVKKLAPLNKNINAKLFLVSRTQIDNVLNLGRKVDEGVGYVSKSDFNKALTGNRKDWKRADSIRKSFVFNRPKILFSGERSSDSDKNIGFYFEITVFDTSDNENLIFELKSWNELKAGGGQEDPISYEFTLPRGQLAIFSGIVSKDHNFSEEERALFESSSSLQILNNESFLEDYSDILLVLELN